MKYALRRVLLRFRFAPLFRAVALPVARLKSFLAIVAFVLLTCCNSPAPLLNAPSGSGCILYIPLNDCPANDHLVDISGNYTVYRSNGVVFTQSAFQLNGVHSDGGGGIATQQGTVFGAFLISIGDPVSLMGESQIHYTIGPAIGNGLPYQSNFEDYLPTAFPFGPMCGLPGAFRAGLGPFAYYSSLNPTCGNSQPGCYPTVGQNNQPYNYTNDSAVPQEVTWNGNSAVLQPGQSTNLSIIWPDGGTGSFNVANQDPNSGTFDNPRYQQPGNITNNVGWNGSQWTNFIAAGVTNDIFPNGPDGGLLGNGMGGVIWSNSVRGVPADNGTMEAGFQLLNNDLLQNQNADTFNWSNYLAQLHNTNNPIDVSGQGQQQFGTNQTSGLASNVWVQNWPSNLFNVQSNNFQQSTQVWVQNWPTNITTNAALGMVWANTNQAGAIVSGASAQVGNLAGMVPNTLDDNSGAASEQDIRITPVTAQQQVVIAMGVLPSSLSTTFSQIRGVIAWFVCILLAIWNFASLFRTIKDVSQVPQAQGPDTGAWAALGANVLTAIVVASAIVAVISVLPVFAVGILAGELTFANSYSSSSPLNFFSSMGWGFQFLSQYLPIYLMFTAFGVRVIYYFGLEVLAFFACIVIKLLIGV